MKRLGTYIVVVVLLLLAATRLYLFLNKDSFEVSSPADSVEIQSLQVCGVESSSQNVQKVGICGAVVTDKPSIPLRMYLYKMPNKIIVAENPVDDRFSTGEFIRQFDLPESNPSNSYKVIVYFYKNVVGQLEFEISSP